MEKYRIYGKEPYQLVLIHGGPGAPGSMAPVARELSRFVGVIEPLQHEKTVKNQVEELKDILESLTSLPVTIIGHSWGAMLGYVFSAMNSNMVKQLIMVGSGVYEDDYVQQIVENRLNRLNDNEKKLFYNLAAQLGDPQEKSKNSIMSKMGKLLTKIDSYNPITLNTEEIEINYDQFKSVWDDAEKMRRSGELLSIGRYMQCPVVALHGDYDPHPVEGIELPLKKVLKNFELIKMEKCGHFPWIEKEAQSMFFKLLRSYI